MITGQAWMEGWRSCADPASFRGPQAPLVHLNGTSGDDLLRQYTEINVAMMKLIELVSAAYPNQRDYYPLKMDAFMRAKQEHDERLKSLNRVREQFARIRADVLSQIRLRRTGDGT